MRAPLLALVLLAACTGDDVDPGPPIDQAFVGSFTAEWIQPCSAPLPFFPYPTDVEIASDGTIEWKFAATHQGYMDRGQLWVDEAVEEGYTRHAYFVGTNDAGATLYTHLSWTVPAGERDCFVDLTRR